MTKEERQAKFLKEHPKFELWQNISSSSRFKFSDGEVEIFTRDFYFKDVSEKKKDEARQALYIERRAGRIKRQPCERCGSVKVQAHHEDYDKPLDVLWLCTRHHADRHVELNRKAIKVLKRFKLQGNKNIKKISRQDGLSTSNA